MKEIRNDTLIIHGDVGPETGNVEYPGKVIIEGSVLAGVAVRSGDDMLVKGHVRGGNLDCGNNLLVVGGIEGENQSVVEVKNDVKVNYIHNASVKSLEGSLFVDADISGSTISAKNKVVLGAEDAMALMNEEVQKQQLGTLKSGVVRLGGELLTNDLGTREKSPVEIIVVSDMVREKVYKALALERKIMVYREELDGLAKMLNLIKILGKNIVNLPPEKQQEIKQQSDRFFYLKNEIQGMAAEKTALEEESKGLTENYKKVPFIKVFHEIFPGVKISIDQLSFSVPYHEKRVCFYKSGMIIMGKLDRIGGSNEEHRIG